MKYGHGSFAIRSARARARRYLLFWRAHLLLPSATKTIKNIIEVRILQPAAEEIEFRYRGDIFQTGGSESDGWDDR